MSTTEVGVAVFSLTRKSNVRTLKLQMSRPLPAKDVNIPPMKPLIRRTIAFHTLNFGICANVVRLWYRFSRNSANANANQILTNPIFFWGGVRTLSTVSNPTTTPTTPPIEHRMSECHSSWTLMKKILKAAADIPQDWIIKEKSRATEGGILKARVMTGKATAPPPSLVIPVG